MWRNLFSVLDAILVAGPREMHGEDSCLVNREGIGPVGSEGVDRVLRTMSSATCSLDPCHS